MSQEQPQPQQQQQQQKQTRQQPRFGIQNILPEFKGENPVKKILERDEAGEFGDEQMRRANALLKNIHPAVYDIMRKSVVGEIISSSSASTTPRPGTHGGGVDPLVNKMEAFVTRLQDDSPVPKASVVLFASLLECVVAAQTSERSKTLDRRLPLVTFIHEFIGSVYEIRLSNADSLKSTACLLRVLSNFALLTTWAFFQGSAKTVAKQPSENFTASLSRTTIMGLRRTSAIETVDPNFTAASTRTNLLHEQINEAFAAMSMMNASFSSNSNNNNRRSSKFQDEEDNNSAKRAMERRLASYYSEPISVPVFDDDDAASPAKGHVQLTRWFLTLTNLAEETEEALIAALLQEIDFVSERLIEHFIDHYEAKLGTSLAGVARNRDDDPRFSQSSNTGISPSRRRLNYDDFDQAKRVLGLVHPLSDDFGKILEAVTEITHLLRPSPLPEQPKREQELPAETPVEDAQRETEDPLYFNFNKQYLRSKYGKSQARRYFINWSHNLAVHRLTCGIISLLLERVCAAVIDAFGICLQHCDSLKDEYLLMRNDVDGCYVKQCLSLLERTLDDDLGLDENCLEALLPLRELCDLLALPPECFETEGIFYSATPRALVNAFVYEKIGQEIPTLVPRGSNQCSIIDLVSCGDILHGCPDDGLKVESDSELTALRWDLEEFSPDEVSATKYRREAESRRIASAKTFSEIYRGIAESLLDPESEEEEEEEGQDDVIHDEGEEEKEIDSKNQTQEPVIRQPKTPSSAPSTTRKEDVPRSSRPNSSRLLQQQQNRNQNDDSEHEEL